MGLSVRTVIMISGILLLWAHAGAGLGSSKSIVSVVSIVNPVSIHACMVKLHSIIGAY